MASNKVRRESKKVTSGKIICPYNRKKLEPGFLFPNFTKDLFFSVFPAPVPDRRVNHGNVTDHTFIFKKLKHIGSGKIGKHFTALRKDFSNYPCSQPKLEDPEKVLVLSCIDSRYVDYVDAVRTLEPFLIEKFGNPYLCRVLMHFRDKVPYQVESYYIASEYHHDGLSLCHRLQHLERMPEDVARFYLAELLSALEDIHARGKILRCLCLCTLMIVPSGHLKICPFSMCNQNLDCGKPCDPITSTCGDQFYASPEVVFGVDVTPSADWWSFGAVMYHLLTGQAPFSGCTLGELGKAITEEDPFFPCELSCEAISIMRCLLHKDPRRRLGWGEDGMEELKKHPFWAGINWLSVTQKFLKPPLKPMENKAEVERTRATIYKKESQEKTG